MNHISKVLYKMVRVITRIQFIIRREQIYIVLNHAQGRFDKHTNEVPQLSSLSTIRITTISYHPLATLFIPFHNQVYLE